MQLYFMPFYLFTALLNAFPFRLNAPTGLALHLQFVGKAFDHFRALVELVIEACRAAGRKRGQEEWRWQGRRYWRGVRKE
jgi:hypothetical protein